MNEEITNIPQNDNLDGAFSSSEGWKLAQRIAKGLSSSSLVPVQYQENIPNCLIAMEVANRTGSSIFAVMQHLYIVHGKPGWSATYLIGTVNSSKRFSPLRFRFEGEGDDWGCRAWAKDRESGEECIGPLVTISMAKKEGWFQKKGSKWQTMPELMLHYRSAAFWTRIYAPELSLGMQTVDEIKDSGPVIAVDDAEIIGESKIDALTRKLKTAAKENSKKDEPEPEPEKIEPLMDVTPLDELRSLAVQLWGPIAETALERSCENQNINLSEINDDEIQHMLAMLKDIQATKE